MKNIAKKSIIIPVHIFKADTNAINTIIKSNANILAILLRGFT